SNFDSKITIGREGAAYLFQGCNDIVVLRGVQREEAVRAKFYIAWESDRALRLLLLSLDPEEDSELRIEAADCLETLLQKHEAKLFVENQLYSRPMPADTDVALLTSSARPLASDLITRIVERQPSISRIRKAWDGLPIAIFENGKKRDFEEHAIR